MFYHLFYVYICVEEFVIFCLLLRLPVGYGGVLNSPRFCFFSRVESRATAHGWYRCAVYRLLSEPMSTRLLNSISSRICRQNTQFNIYTTTSKQQEGWFYSTWRIIASYMVRYRWVRIRRKYTHDSQDFANVHQLMFLVPKLVWIRIEYSLVL